jgi:hypothetical protein
MTTLPAAPRLSRSRAVGRSLPRARSVLLALLVLAAALYLWSLSRNGWTNDYYSAAVRSMGTDWHDFLCASFDARGVVTVDKRVGSSKLMAAVRATCKRAPTSDGALYDCHGAARALRAHAS